MEILIISGLSGAGKSSAATYLEDMGYYTEDNLPDDSKSTLTDPRENTRDPAAG